MGGALKNPGLGTSLGEAIGQPHVGWGRGWGGRVLVIAPRTVQGTSAVNRCSCRDGAPDAHWHTSRTRHLE